jgi:hypothetical protein
MQAGNLGEAAVSLRHNPLFGICREHKLAASVYYTILQAHVVMMVSGIQPICQKKHVINRAASNFVTMNLRSAFLQASRRWLVLRDANQTVCLAPVRLGCVAPHSRRDVEGLRGARMWMEIQLGSRLLFNLVSASQPQCCQMPITSPGILVTRSVSRECHHISRFRMLTL